MCPVPPAKDKAGADVACTNPVRFTVSPKYIDPTSDGLVAIAAAWQKLETDKVTDVLLDCAQVGDGILQCIYDSQVGYKDCAEKCNPKPKHETFIQLTKKEFCPAFTDPMEHTKLYEDYKAKVSEWESDSKTAKAERASLNARLAAQQLA